MDKDIYLESVKQKWTWHIFTQNAYLSLKCEVRMNVFSAFLYLVICPSEILVCPSDEILYHDAPCFIWWAVNMQILSFLEDAFILVLVILIQWRVRQSELCFVILRTYVIHVLCQQAEQSSFAWFCLHQRSG